VADLAGPENPRRDAGFAGDVRGEVVAAPPANGAGEKRKQGSVADVAQLVEHSLGKGEVISSILIIGSRVCSSCANVQQRAGVTQW
jgi:hypothetical protein